VRARLYHNGHMGAHHTPMSTKSSGSWCHEAPALALAPGTATASARRAARAPPRVFVHEALLRCAADCRLAAIASGRCVGGGHAALGGARHHIAGQRFGALAMVAAALAACSDVSDLTPPSTSSSTGSSPRDDTSGSGKAGATPSGPGDSDGGSTTHSEPPNGPSGAHGDDAGSSPDSGGIVVPDADDVPALRAQRRAAFAPFVAGPGDAPMGRVRHPGRYPVRRRVRLSTCCAAQRPACPLLAAAPRR
jgi:hypothetical protein